MNPSLRYPKVVVFDKGLRCLFCKSPLEAKEIKILKGTENIWAFGFSTPVTVLTGNKKIRIELECPTCKQKVIAESYRFSFDEKTKRIFILKKDLSLSLLSKKV